MVLPPRVGRAERAGSTTSVARSISITSKTIPPFHQSTKSISDGHPLDLRIPMQCQICHKSAVVVGRYILVEPPLGTKRLGASAAANKAQDHPAQPRPRQANRKEISPSMRTTRELGRDGTAIREFHATYIPPPPPQGDEETTRRARRALAPMEPRMHTCTYNKQESIKSKKKNTHTEYISTLRPFLPPPPPRTQPNCYFLSWGRTLLHVRHAC